MTTQFLNALTPIDPKELFERVQERNSTSNKTPAEFPWIVRNEISASDLFCYLGARFGRPNGMQNHFRNDSSDNLIHWEWALLIGDCIVLIQGMNFRTEIHFLGQSDLLPNSKEEMIKAIKSDFSNHGEVMAQVRSHLEHWDEFLNPYQRIRTSIEVLRSELNSLDLNPKEDEIPDLTHATDIKAYEQRWKDVSEKYSRGIGICFGIRAMLPVRAEAFVNMLLFILMRSDVRRDQRLFDSVFKQQIDVRVRSLHLHCVEFSDAVDYSQLADFHTLMMKRNDLLHGNVNLKDLIFGDVRFMGKVPVFERYLSVWDRAFGVMLNGVGFSEWQKELSIVESAEHYLLGLVSKDRRNFIEAALQARELGMERSERRLGVLFSNQLVDFSFRGKKQSD